MDIVTLVIVFICVSGATITAYSKGVMNGAEATITILEAQKIIKVDDDGDIKPYK